MKESKKELEIEESWNIKRVAIALAIFVFLMGAVVYLINGSATVSKIRALFTPSQSEEATNAAQTITRQDAKGVRAAVENQLNSIKQEASKINVEEVATSSPQVKKVINDIKSLENYPANQARNFCERICNSF